MDANDFAATEDSAINVSRLLAASIATTIPKGTNTSSPVCLLFFDNGSRIEIPEGEGKTLIAFIGEAARRANRVT